MLIDEAVDYIIESVILVPDFCQSVPSRYLNSERCYFFFFTHPNPIQFIGDILSIYTLRFKGSIGKGANRGWIISTPKPWAMVLAFRLLE